MKSNFIAYKNSTIHYSIYGNGLRLLFCFHGYGEDAECFNLLEAALGSDYTLIAMDMPFHGKTVWQDGLLFTVYDLIALMQRIITSIHLINQSIPQQPTYSLLGYSMGGRIALQLLQKSPKDIERVVLAAPDGLHKNLWYRFAISLIGNKVFKYATHRPPGSFSVLKVIEKLKLAHPSWLKIVHYYTDEENERLLLYRRWTTMRKFRPNLPLLKKLIKRHALPVRFLFGRFDNIIVSSRSDIFKDDTQNVQVHIIDAGHRLMQEKYVPVISNLFYQ